MSAVLVEPVRCARDSRGFVFEPIGPELIPSQKNVHVVISEPGAIRGNHYHPLAIEIALVMGPALARFREQGKIWDATVPEGEVHRFTIPPGISHAFQNTGAKPIVLTAFNTVLYDPARPDLVRDVLI